jgi:hypothetical protein
MPGKWAGGLRVTRREALRGVQRKALNFSRSGKAFGVREGQQLRREVSLHEKLVSP